MVKLYTTCNSVSDDTTSDVVIVNVLMNTTSNVELPEVVESYVHTFKTSDRAPPWFNGSVLDHSSLTPVFESRRGHT